MATLMTKADGDFTAAATWAVVDAVSLLDFETTSQFLSTTYVESQAFTPGAITIDGMAVKILSIPTATGTLTFRLAQAGATVAGTETSIPVPDLPPSGWFFFRFAAPVTLAAATAYTASAKTTTIGGVNLVRNATANNFCRMLRTTTAAAPAAGDNLLILREWTASATYTPHTVTMNSTAATDYGSASTTFPVFVIGAGATLTWANTAALAYTLRLSGSMQIEIGGSMYMGSAASPCPRTTSMQLEFDCTADGEHGLRVYGTLIAQGLSRTDGKNVVMALLNTDEAVGQTALGLDRDTGWLNGDDIAIASTTRTWGQAEQRTLNGNAAADSCTVTLGLTNAHSGTSPTQAEVINLTRQVRIQSVSATFMAFVSIGPVAVVDCDWVAFRYLGGLSTTGKRGLEIATTTGSVSLSYVALRNFDTQGIYCVSGFNNVTLEHVVGYLLGGSNTNGVMFDNTTGTNWHITDLTLIMASSSGSTGLQIGNASGAITGLGAGTLSRIRVSSAGIGILVIGSYANGLPIYVSGTWGDWNTHSNHNIGVEIRDIGSAVISNVTSWRNNLGGTWSGGVNVSATWGGRLVFNNGTAFGNNAGNIGFGASTAGPSRRVTFRNWTVAGDTTFATPVGFMFHTNANDGFLTLDNCTFGVVSGIFTAHSQADIDYKPDSWKKYVEGTYINTLLASPTEQDNLASLVGRSFIARQNIEQNINSHEVFYPTLGTVAYDVVTYRTASPSEKLSLNPVTATYAVAGNRLESSPRRVVALAGDPVNIACYVRKDAAYVGEAPRLMLRCNPALGITDDQVIATFSASAGVWQQLSGTTPVAPSDGVFEFFVDCTGNAGFINVDDWEAS